MLVLRRILFYFFFLTYLVLCPLLILYAFGVIFKPENQSLQKTGIIYLATTPPGATVYINHQPFAEPTPTIIQNLPPGKFHIELMLKDYKLWAKDIPVEATKATAPENILLIPQDWNLEKYSVNAYQDLISFSPHPFFLLRQGPLLKDLFVFRWKEDLKNAPPEENAPLETQGLFPLVKPEDPMAKAEIIKINTVPGSSCLVIESKLQDNKIFSWINLEDTNNILKDITPLFPLIPEEIVWESRDNNELYSLQKGILNFVDLSAQAIHPQIIKDVRSVAPHHHNLYTLLENYSIMRYDRNGENPLPLLEDTPFAKSLFGKYKKLRLSVLSEKILVFLSENGALVSNQLPYNLVADGIRGFKFDENHERLLFWKDADVGFIDFTPPAEDGLFEKGPRINWLNVAAAHIRDAFWVNNGAQILYLDNDKVLITETHSFGQPEVQQIVIVKKGSAVSYLENLGRLFFLEEKTGQLMSVPIFTKESLITLPGHNEPEQQKADIPGDKP